MYSPNGTVVEVLPHNVELMTSRGWSIKRPKGATSVKFSINKAKELSND